MFRIRALLRAICLSALCVCAPAFAYFFDSEPSIEFAADSARDARNQPMSVAESRVATFFAAAPKTVGASSTHTPNSAPQRYADHLRRMNDTLTQRLNLPNRLHHLYVFDRVRDIDTASVDPAFEHLGIVPTIYDDTPLADTDDSNWHNFSYMNAKGQCMIALTYRFDPPAIAPTPHTNSTGSVPSQAFYPSLTYFMRTHNAHPLQPLIADFIFLHELAHCYYAQSALTFDTPLEFFERTLTPQEHFALRLRLALDYKDPLTRRYKELHADMLGSVFFYQLYKDHPLFQATLDHVRSVRTHHSAQLTTDFFNIHDTRIWFDYLQQHPKVLSRPDAFTFVGSTVASALLLQYAQSANSLYETFYSYFVPEQFESTMSALLIDNYTKQRYALDYDVQGSAKSAAAFEDPLMQPFLPHLNVLQVTQPPSRTSVDARIEAFKRLQERMQETFGAQRLFRQPG